MVRTVDQGDLEVDHREPGDDARLLGRLEALLDARNVFLRHRAADDLVLEQETGPRLLRLEHQLDAREMAGAARLLLVGVVRLRLRRDGLAVGHLGRADVRRSEEHTSELQSLMRIPY